ncbi:conserved hypothetical protein [Histoplasma capsulatum H143]|uniref:Uncharacterized protein n=1 Tax=Ajellomyces capsulatus (strain H143) TaxID=544712 RepID=C6HAV7_AJECH|nr:conserved hypothetical protein [Histoplasma capsulatum H143]
MAPASAVSLGLQGRGKKRPAGEELEGEQRRLAKKFGLMHIAPSISIPPPIPRTPLNNQDDSHSTSPPVLQPQYPKPVAPATAPVDEFMQIDETKHRVYIHDLDREIAEIETQEKNDTPFLRDIEKRVMCVPKSVLGASSDSSHTIPSANNALVLYRPPSSLSVPKPQDGVPMAVIEATEQAHAKAESARTEKEQAKDMAKEVIGEKGHGALGMSILRSGSSLDLLASSTAAMLPLPEPLDLDSPFDAEPMEIDGN